MATIPKVIQVNTINGGSSVASQAITMSNGNTPGNLLVMAWRNLGTTVTVSDSAGNTWTTVLNSPVGLAWAPITVVSGPSGATPGQNTVTWHSVGNTFPRIILVELYGGVTGITGWSQPSNNSSSSAGTTTPNSGSISDSLTDILVGVCQNNTDTTILTTSWTNCGFSPATNDPGMFFLAPTGTDSFSGTSASTSWDMGIFNFRPTFAPTALQYISV
jgi:hypothetical protein